MTETSRTGGTGIGAVVGVLGLVAALSIGAIALGSGTPAGASGLEQFSSCEELEAWTGEATAGAGAAGEGDVVLEDSGTDAAEGSAAAPAPAASDGAAGRAGDESFEAGDDTDQSGLATTNAGPGDAGDTGGTNTVVEGVDEIDVLDRIGEDRLLVSRNGVLVLVDLAGRAIVAEHRPLPWDARISVAGDLVWIAGTTVDGMGTEVRRVRVDGDAFVDDGSWTTPGYLQDARRTGDRLHVVAVDHPEAQTLPFEDGPVPCDQVWRPVDPATTPAATLVATLPAEGPLEPTAAAEVTGSGGNLLVTGAAVYIATETWDEAGTITTGVHRFDLAGLTPTGSGTVPGSVAGPFAMNEHDGTLRVATNAGFGFGFGRPMPADDVAVDVADVGIDPAGAQAPGTTAEDAASLAEVFVLDTDGDLDVLGRTGRFGHDGETIHGVRFVGDVAYVVTFLQTDPFWVVDLADPAAPEVVGELEIPGFSGYLHPVTDDRVVGFGPDGSGSMAARLFDVSDPSAPAVIDEIALGQDTPAAYDHHAFVGLGDRRFAVPFTDHPIYREVTECANPVPVEPELQPEPLPAPDVVPTDPGPGGGTSGSPGVAAEEAARAFSCEPVAEGGETGAVVLEVVDGRLSIVERASVTGRGDVYAERVVALPDGAWLLLSWDRLVATDGGTEIALPVS